MEPSIKMDWKSHRKTRPWFIYSKTPFSYLQIHMVLNFQNQYVYDVPLQTNVYLLSSVQLTNGVVCIPCKSADVHIMVHMINLESFFCFIAMHIESHRFFSIRMPLTSGKSTLILSSAISRVIITNFPTFIGKSFEFLCF